MFDRVGYAFRRISRNGRLFLALFVGVLLATTFFSSINVSAEVNANRLLREALQDVYYEARVSYWGSTPSIELPDIQEEIRQLGNPDILESEIMSRVNYYHTSESDPSEYISYEILGISNTSQVYNGAQLLAGSLELGPNETLVEASSYDFSDFQLGNIISMNLSRDYPISSSIIRIKSETN